MLYNIASRATFLLVVAQLGMAHAGESGESQRKPSGTFYNGTYISLALNPVYLSYSQLQLYDVGTGISITPATQSFEPSVLGFGASLGYSLVAINVPARFEAEYIYLPKVSANFNPVYNSGADADLPLPRSVEQARMNSTISSSTVMFNGLYDFVNDTRFIPYFMGGLGFTYTATESHVANNINPVFANYSQGNTSIAWNVGAGMRVKATKRLFIDVLYRFMRLGSVDWGTLTYPKTPGGTYAFNLRANQAYGNMLSFKATWQG
jgi:opacity protein-like surface antigen